MRLLAFLLAGAPGTALAHHFMGGATPQTFVQGLLSGLGHPLIGADHAAFIVGAGFVLAAVNQGVPAIGALILGSLAGAVLHLAGIGIPASEALVALSVILVGALLIFRKSPSWRVAVALLLVTGLLHGYAYAESIFGAEPAPLGAYILGFSLIQFAVALAALMVARRFMLKPLFVGTGALISVVGAAFLAAAL